MIVPDDKQSSKLARLRIDRSERPLGRRKEHRWLIPLVVIAVVGLAAWLIAGDTIGAYLGKRLAALSGKSLTVRIGKVRRIEAAQGAELTTAQGWVVPRKSASLGSKILGRVGRLLVEPGDRVQRGQVLAELEHVDLDAALAAAEARTQQAIAEQAEAEKSTKLARLDQTIAIERAAAAGARAAEAAARLADDEREMKRAQELRDTKTGSQREADRTRATYEAQLATHRSLLAEQRAAKLRVQSAEQEVELKKAQEATRASTLAVFRAQQAQVKSTRNDAFIRAPFDGVILRKEAEVGEVIAPSPGGSALSRSAVLTMADFRTLEMEVDVIERDIPLVQVGGAASIRLDAYPRDPRRGRVRLVRPTADRQKATVQVKVEFAEIPPFARPEMAGTVVFLAKGQAERAEERARVLAPATAIVRRGSQTAVWIVRKGTAHERNVRIGKRVGESVEITEGLEGGERLILEPPPDLVDGASVRETQNRQQEK